SRRRHTRSYGDWSSDVCSSDLYGDGRYVLAVQATGNAAAIARYQFEIGSLAKWAALDGAEQETFWTQVRDFTPRFLATNRDGARSEERRVGKECVHRKYI